MKVDVGGKKVEITAPPHMYGDENNMLHDIMLVKLPNDPKTEHVKLPDCVSEDLPKT